VINAFKGNTLYPDLLLMLQDQYEDISKIDVESDDFKALPPDVQHEIMTDMRLRKKNYNLSKIVDLPDVSILLI
jgi:hypothetical protein